MQRFFAKIIESYIKRKREELGLLSDQIAVFNLDCWSVHRSLEFREWMEESYPNTKLEFVPPGRTGRAQVGDLLINKKLKEIIKKEAIQYLATEIQNQLYNKDKEIKVSFLMNRLKANNCCWVSKGYSYFNTT